MKKRMFIIKSIWTAFIAAMIVTPLHVRAEESSLRVMSYNIHRGGVVHLKQPLSQTVKVIQAAKADIVGIQETRSPRGDTLEDLAKLLGWNRRGELHCDPLRNRRAFQRWKGLQRWYQGQACFR